MDMVATVDATSEGRGGEGQGEANAPLIGAAKFREAVTKGGIMLPLISVPSDMDDPTEARAMRHSRARASSTLSPGERSTDRQRPAYTSVIIMVNSDLIN